MQGRSPKLIESVGRRFAVIAGGSFAAFDTDSGRLVAGKVSQYDRGSDVDGLAISSDGGRVTYVQSTNAVVWDMATPQPLGIPAYAPGTIYDFAVSPDAAWLVCRYRVGRKGNQDVVATGIWNLRTGSLIGHLDPADGLPTFNFSGNLLAVTGTGESQENTTILNVGKDQ